ncbi:Pentatricopeptide repeat-containing protein [Platanthera guangdongensis]|uniref:Pentatricopeptide repeat-containing protein n=1 Tax=Platanthera guangdongensis TaxID=2320717 RepID=A0ABR2N4S2_9ASPA
MDKVTEPESGDQAIDSFNLSPYLRLESDLPGSVEMSPENLEKSFCSDLNSTHSSAAEAAKFGLISLLASHRNPEISLFSSKGFSEISRLINGRALQCFCLRHASNLSVFHINTLLSMYFRFGKPSIALNLFDKMPVRNHASWNTVISGCVRAGRSSVAVDLFRKMREEGGDSNGFMLASLVTACTRDKDMVSRGTQIHGFVLKLGLMSNVYVGTALLHLYGNNDLLTDAQRFFQEMPEKNVVTWTALMVSYSANSQPSEAVRAYRNMRLEGVVCNENSYATVISSCGSLQSEILSSQILAHVVVSGFEAEVSVANSLLTLFGNAGNVDEAEQLFLRMTERDTISWNSLLSVYLHEGMCEEALLCFARMRRSNFKPDATTFSCTISACANVDHEKWGRGLHSSVMKNNLESSPSVCNALISTYSAFGKTTDAEMLFRGMPAKDAISWNTMMRSYGQSGDVVGAIKLFSEMLRLSIECNHVTFATALAACAGQECLSDGKMIHALVMIIGLGESLLVANSLITMYSKCRAMREAERVFLTMPDCDLITWNSIIGGYVEDEDKNMVIQTLNHMRRAGFSANYITVLNVLGVFSTPHDLRDLGRPLHAHAISEGLEVDEFVLNSLITMYANCGDLESGEYIFDRISGKNVVSWNALIASKARHGQGEDAMKHFKEMFSAGMELDQFSLSGGLSASACLASRDEGRQIHSLIIKLGFCSDPHVVNASMDMYGKCGRMDDVLKLLPEPSQRSRLSWNIMISCYARHGQLLEAEETFGKMLLVGPKPDHVTFVSLLAACNHAGLVEKGLEYYNMMSSEFGISPRIEHCACIIDLLGRSGRLAEAEKFAGDMPVTPNGLIWRSLLSASRTHRRLDIGEKAARHLLQLNPSDDSAYVLLANAYALSGKWADVESLRARMSSIDLKKREACSWIQVKNKVSRFGAGDKSHPQAEEVYSKLEWMLELVKEAGYVADTSQELHDTDEEQKECSLWSHSEKLALAFGLMAVPEGCPITVFKNLRVCGDCHLVYKLVSGTVESEIVLRDPYRFHHFRGGACSCSDYW